MKDLRAFVCYLKGEEKSEATIEKYVRDVAAFFAYGNDRPITKQLLLDYKQSLLDMQYLPSSINSMLASVNAWLRFTGQEHLKVRQLKIQRQIYCPEEKELSRQEYVHLVRIAQAMGEEQTALIMQTICATGIRVSELQFITVEAVHRQVVQVNCKGKHRRVFLVSALCERLERYITREHLEGGPIFCNERGEPLDRNSIWRMMKRVSREARVDARKVFPHNLRHLFAKEYYAGERDIAKLADILGHSNINTTRIYVCSSGQEHRQQLERMDLVV